MFHLILTLEWKSGNLYDGAALGECLVPLLGVVVRVIGRDMCGHQGMVMGIPLPTVRYRGPALNIQTPARVRTTPHRGAPLFDKGAVSRRGAPAAATLATAVCGAPPLQLGQDLAGRGLDAQLLACMFRLLRRVCTPAVVRPGVLGARRCVVPAVHSSSI